MIAARVWALLCASALAGCASRYIVAPAELRKIDGYVSTSGSTDPRPDTLEDDRGTRFRLKKHTYFRLKLKQDAKVAGELAAVAARGEYLMVVTEDGQELALPFDEI